MKKIIFLSLIVLFSFPVNKKLTAINEIEVAGTVVVNFPFVALNPGVALAVSPDFYKNLGEVDPDGKYVDGAKNIFMNTLQESLKGTPVKIDASKFSKELDPGKLPVLSWTPGAYARTVADRFIDPYLKENPKEGDGVRYVAVAVYSPYIASGNTPIPLLALFYPGYVLGLVIYKVSTKGIVNSRLDMYKITNYVKGSPLPATNPAGVLVIGKDLKVGKLEKVATAAAETVVKAFTKQLVRDFQ